MKRSRKIQPPIVAEVAESETEPALRRPRYSIATMMMLTFITSLVSWAASNLVRESRDKAGLEEVSASARMIFILSVLVGPVVLLLVVSFIRFSMRAFGRK